MSEIIGVPITDTAQANEALQAIYQGAYDGACVVARGRVRIPDILPGFALVIHRLDPTKDDLVKMGGKGTIYAARFVREVAAVANVTVEASTRTDDGANPFLRGYEVVVSAMDLLLRRRQAIGRYELDLRDGAPKIDTLGGDAKKTRDAREFVAAKAETGAFCRAVVQLLALPRGSRAANIASVPLFVPCMEMHAASAPDEVRRAMSMGAVQAMLGAFGPAPTTPAIAPAPAAPMGLPSAWSDDAPPAAWDDTEAPPESWGDDDPPFAEPDAPAAITDAQRQELVALGVNAGALRALGWVEGQPVTQAIYEAAVAKYGGA